MGLLFTGRVSDAIVCVFLAGVEGLAVGLDPEGYGNPDYCWLSVYDTLIWSFAGPIAMVVGVRTRPPSAPLARHTMHSGVLCCVTAFIYPDI